VAYADFDRLRNIMGSDRLLGATPKGLTDETAEAYWTAKLNAAAGQMDLYFSRAGFTTPLDTAAIPVAQQDAALNWLAEGNAAIAFTLGQPALVQSPKGVTSAADRFVGLLEKIARGTLRLPWLSQPEPVFASLSSADVDSSDSGVPPLTGAMFGLLRNAPDR
jgi:hypothetical protein